MKFLVFVFYLNVSKVLVFRRYKANSAHESLEWASSDNLTRKYSGLKCHLEEDPLKFFFKESMHFFLIPFLLSNYIILELLPFSNVLLKMSQSFKL